MRRVDAEQGQRLRERRRAGPRQADAEHLGFGEHLAPRLLKAVPHPFERKEMRRGLERRAAVVEKGAELVEALQREQKAQLQRGHVADLAHAGEQPLPKRAARAALDQAGNERKTGFDLRARPRIALQMQEQRRRVGGRAERDQRLQRGARVRGRDVREHVADHLLAVRAAVGRAAASLDAGADISGAALDVRWILFRQAPVDRLGLGRMAQTQQQQGALLRPRAHGLVGIGLDAAGEQRQRAGEIAPAERDPGEPVEAGRIERIIVRQRLVQRLRLIQPVETAQGVRLVRQPLRLRAEPCDAAIPAIERQRPTPFATGLARPGDPVGGIVGCGRLGGLRIRAVCGFGGHDGDQVPVLARAELVSSPAYARERCVSKRTQDDAQPFGAKPAISARNASLLIVSKLHSSPSLPASCRTTAPCRVAKKTWPIRIGSPASTPASTRPRT